ncbi:MAG: beta-Ig-H3/fasciclin [Dehalococcoidia bacterium]|nr:beta-Ig-H3/fasciclin [Dehalococcoidia bacterium]
MTNLFKTKKLTYLLISILALFTFIACSSDDTSDEVNEIEEIQIIEKSTPYSNDLESELSSIAEIATEDGRFNTLVTALVEADLAETLSGEGTFTVFAPTDEAFAALPDGTLEGLLADKEALSGVLLYHVLGSVVMAENVVEVSEATTLQGSDIAVEVVDEKVFVNDSQVIITDLEASNGVIHVIDKVLIP